MGPWIVTRDEIEDPNALELRVSINGSLKGVGHVSDMHHSIQDMIAFASEGEKIVPGEFFGTGAPGDCTGIEHWEFLNSGDVMKLEITSVGTLENKVA
jgi:2-keto-4-pentenoate hydratase/2-oxohepta-3-ene-1,7-dioic acid hydratase in catechol pathway